MDGLSVKIENVSDVKKRLFIEVEAAKVDAEIEKVYQKIGRTAKIKGFRPGKVPRSVLEKYYAPEMEQQVLNRLINDSYFKALIDNKIPAVSDPEITDNGTLEKGQPFSYQVQVEVKPEIEPKDYVGLELQKERFESDPQVVDNQLEEMRNGRAEMVVSERDEARAGDTVVIDFEGFVDGEAFQNGSAENYQLELGSGTFLPGFEEQLVGMKRGEEREVNVSFPESYGVENLSGKPALFKVSLKDIKEKKVPDLDDAFAKSFGVDTLEALRQRLLENYESREKQRIEAELRERLVNALLERNSFEVPAVMVADQCRQMFEDARRRLAAQGMSMEMLGMDEDRFAAQYREQAENQVKGSLILEAIGRQEQIKVDEAEIDARMQEISAMAGVPIEEVRKRFGNSEARPALVGRIIEDKVFDFLVDKASVIEVAAEELNPAEEAGQEA
ncbi:trigger factor [Geoalkalibacter halelectricus]|uniref:trigger factor n=1 Tax=Geoalkalibacter halelectricus TaxID=2847045 RepID=UPI003D1965EA